MTDDARQNRPISPTEGLRERKKRLTRQLITETATEMFLARGFDEVKVTEIAEACEVSEKTVYNYFPTKESLLLDREVGMADALRRTLGPDASARSPVEAMLAMLAQDLDEVEAHWRSAGGGPEVFLRFVHLIDSTPSLRSAQRDMMDRLVQVAAQSLAARVGVSPDDPEPQLAGHSLLALWRIQFHAIRRYAGSGEPPEKLREQVSSEVRRAARLVESGMYAFEFMVSGGNGREQWRAAAETAQGAARQVATALRQAQAAWRQVQAEAGNHQDRREDGRGRRAQQQAAQDRRRAHEQRRRDRVRRHGQTRRSREG